VKIVLILLPIYLVGSTLSLVSSKNINFKEFISEKNSTPIYLNQLPHNCKAFIPQQNKKYIAKHYIKEGKVICQNSVKEYKKRSVIVNFGSFEIEKHGELIYENREYIKIKTPNGKVEKIYKNGAIK
jgi:hypothetical protein